MTERPDEPVVREREPAPEPERPEGDYYEPQPAPEGVQERHRYYEPEQPVREVGRPERGYYAPPPEPTRTSPLALASVGTGIAAWVFIPVIGAIAAVITGFLAKDEIRRSGGRLTGNGLATAGLVLGWVQIGGIIILAIVAAATAGAIFL